MFRCKGMLCILLHYETVLNVSQQVMKSCLFRNKLLLNVENRTFELVLASFFYKNAVNDKKAVYLNINGEMVK